MLSEDDVHYLWLPLSHVFAKVLLLISTDVGMQTAVDGRIDKIVDNLGEVRPTFMAAAPRIFEKVYGRISLGMEEEGGAKAKIFAFASEAAREYSRTLSDNRRPGLLLGLKHTIGDKLVFGKVRERFGGRVRFFISGSAALNQDIATGSTAPACRSSRLRPHRDLGGRDGQPALRPAGRLRRLAHAADGHQDRRGRRDPHPRRARHGGYHNNPEATAEVLSEDGWFHSGDIGEIDADGFVKVTDRKKDLFKTSNGKYVAPSLIESTFKGLCPYVGQLLVHGESRQFVTALITLDEEAIKPWAEANGLEGASYTEIVSSLQAREMVQGYVDQLNAGLNRHEQIKKFHILGRDLTVEDGELTPSLKLRRKVVAEKFKGDIEEMYPS